MGKCLEVLLKVHDMTKAQILLHEMEGYRHSLQEPYHVWVLVVNTFHTVSLTHRQLIEVLEKNNLHHYVEAIWPQRPLRGPSRQAEMAESTFFFIFRSNAERDALTLGQHLREIFPTASVYLQEDEYDPVRQQFVAPHNKYPQRYV